MANTDFTLTKLRGHPISVNVNRPVSLGSTVGDDFVHNSYTGRSNGSPGDFVTVRRPKQPENPVENPVAAAAAATPPAVTPKSVRNRKVHPTIKSLTLDGK